jgi:hypothetical protein
MIRPYVELGEYVPTIAFDVTAFVLEMTGVLTPFRVLVLAAVIGAVAVPSEAR